MNRREAISAVAWLIGGSVLGADLFVEMACNPKSKSASVSDLFQADHIRFMDEISDTILPETSTPGAKAAKVGNFMAVMVRDCYKPEDQKVFMDGLNKIDELSGKKYGKKFMDLDSKQRTALLTTLDAEQKAYQADKKRGEPNHYFRMMKELTLLGYFTSEIGCTRALRYVPVPGRFDGCIPYKKGDRAWAT